MSYLISVVIAIVFLTVLVMFFMGRGKTASSKSNKKAKNKNQIIKEANKRLAKNPHDPAGLIPLGNVYFSSSIWDKACSIYSELVKLGVKAGIDMAECYLRLGICNFQLDKTPEAFQALFAAYKINPNDFSINFNLGKTLLKMEQYDKASPLFKKALLAKPDATGVYFLLGQSLYKAKKYKDALPILKKAYDEEPGNKEALFDLADAMFQEGQGSGAEKVFMHLRADPVYGAKSCLQVGLFHLKGGKVEEAMQDFEIGLKHTNTPLDITIELEYNLSRCYFEKKQISHGLSLLKSIRNKAPSYKDVNSLIGRYQELSQNSNLQIYISANNSDFLVLCRKFVMAKYQNAAVRVQKTETKPLYTDILVQVSSSNWEDIVLFRFFRTIGSTGEIYIRELHSYRSDVNAERCVCVSAGTFTAEAKKYVEGRPIDLVEKTELTKLLKKIDS